MWSWNGEVYFKHKNKKGKTVTQMVKNLPAMQETHVQSLGREDALEEGIATHSSILAWWIPWTEEPAAAKSLQLCLTLCDPIDGSPPGSPVPWIFQARTLEWVAISFSNAWKWKVKGKSLSCVWLLATPWTAAHQAPPSMGFSRQEYWSGVPLPSPTEEPGRLQSMESQRVGHDWTTSTSHFF